MKSVRVWLVSLLFILLCGAFITSCARKSGCPGIDKTINKKVKAKDKKQLFDKKMRRKMVS